MRVLYPSYFKNVVAMPLQGVDSGQAEAASQERIESGGYRANFVT